MDVIFISKLEKDSIEKVRHYIYLLYLEDYLNSDQFNYFMAFPQESWLPTLEAHFKQYPIGG